jgi:hypothetical protein
LEGALADPADYIDQFFDSENTQTHNDADWYVIERRVEGVDAKERKELSYACCF